MVYFAGQAIGLPPPDDAASAGIQRHYLLPIDARPAGWDETGWRLDEAIDGLAATGRNPIVLLLDTSLHGRGKRVDPSSRFEPSATPFLEQLVRWPGVTAWLAADGRPAVEATAVDEHSAFTAALLKGLGTTERPHNLLACLNAMTQEPALAAQGFRTLGGIAPGLNLWPASLRREVASERELLLQRGHAAGVSTIAFSADGSRMITGGQDSTVRVWRMADRMLLRVLPYHMVGVTGLALSPDGRLLASGDGDGLAPDVGHGQGAGTPRRAPARIAPSTGSRSSTTVPTMSPSTSTAGAGSGARRTPGRKSSPSRRIRRPWRSRRSRARSHSPWPRPTARSCCTGPMGPCGRPWTGREGS